MRLIPSLVATLVFALAASAASAQTAQPAGSERGRADCFLSNTWKNWTVTPEGDTLDLRIHANDVFRVDLTPGTHATKCPNCFLVYQVRGSGWTCSPVDLDLTLANNIGLRKPRIARALRRLTPAEAKQLRSALRP
jgi:hypothetical protein